MQQIELTPSFVKNDQGLSIIDRDALHLPANFAQALPERLLTMQPGGWGGDHTHEHEEAFIGFSPDVYIVWRDESGQRHESPMMSQSGQHFLFIVPSQLPHLVENRGDIPAIIYEIRDREDPPATMLAEGASLRVL